jgi:hypothetical protein
MVVQRRHVRRHPVSHAARRINRVIVAAHGLCLVADSGWGWGGWGWWQWAQPGQHHLGQICVAVVVRVAVTAGLLVAPPCAWLRYGRTELVIKSRQRASQGVDTNTVHSTLKVLAVSSVQPALGICVFQCEVPPIPPNTSMGAVVRLASRPISGTRTGSIELIIVMLGYVASGVLSCISGGGGMTSAIHNMFSSMHC